MARYRPPPTACPVHGTHVCTHAYMHVYVHACTHVPLRMAIRMAIRMPVRMPVRVRLHARQYAWLCACACMHGSVECLHRPVRAEVRTCGQKRVPVREDTLDRLGGAAVVLDLHLNHERLRTAT